MLADVDQAVTPTYNLTLQPLKNNDLITFSWPKLPLTTAPYPEIVLKIDLPEDLIDYLITDDSLVMIRCPRLGQYNMQYVRFCYCYFREYQAQTVS
jgi:hypothetical protein